MQNIIDEISSLSNLQNCDGSKARYPVHVGFEYGRLMLVRGGGGGEPSPPKHEEVRIFTQSSKRRMSKYLRTARSNYVAMGTLTYPVGFKVTAFEAYYHLVKLEKRWVYLKSMLDPNFKQSHSWFWFKEFQNNGQIHLHFFSTETIHHQWLAKAWYQVVGSGNPNHLKAGTSICRIKSGRPGMVRYAYKYAKKQEQKLVPESFGKAGRFWGILGNNAVSAVTYTYSTKKSTYRNYVEDVISEFEHVLNIKRRSKAPIYKVIEWEKDIWGYKLTGKTIEITCPLVKARWDKLVEDYSQDAEGDDLPPKPYDKPIFHAMRCRPNSLELLRRYRKLEERNYQLRCKEIRISGDCTPDQRPDDTRRGTEEARRNKKFRLEAWAVSRYRERMGN